MPSRHLAALSLKAGEPLSIQSRNTPNPGPHEILIQVKALAMNPVDQYQRDHGLPPVPQYPAILGSDVAGIVHCHGPDVPRTAPAPGTRVLALATSFFHSGDPNHGAFQQYVLARCSGVIALPPDLSYAQGASLPLAVSTALTAYTTLSIPLTTQPAPPSAQPQAILVWGAASSVGTLAVQSARALGYVVYAVARGRNHAYLRSLGATCLFDYTDPCVVSDIVAAVKASGHGLQTAHVVVAGGLEPTLAVLGECRDPAVPAWVAHSPVLPAEYTRLENVVVRFNFPPTEEGEWERHVGRCFQGWLKRGLEEGTVVPSPPVEVVGRGLEKVDEALDRVREGVSCRKIVVTL